MTPAERAYRLALLAYPAPYRRERGLEILTTILDGGDERWPPRGRELVAIVLDGVARRGQLAGGGSRTASIRAGVRLAAFVWLLPYAIAGVMWAVYPYVGAAWPGGGPASWRSAYTALVALAGVAALTRAWWWGPLAVSLGSTALLALAVPYPAAWPWQDPVHPGPGTVVFALGFVPGIACVLARPRAGEPPDRRSPLWVPFAVGAGAVLAWQGLFVTSWLGRPIAVALVAGFVLARRDPRLAMAAASVALLAAIVRIAEPANVGHGPIWLGAGALVSPLLLTLALASLWRLRQAPA